MLSILLSIGGVVCFIAKILNQFCLLGLVQTSDAELFMNRINSMQMNLNKRLP